jgi:hypothetical protein
MGVSQRRPIFPPWSPAGRRGCPDCGDPVEYAVLDVYPTLRTHPERIAIERRVNATGTIAVRWIGDQLHGHRITAQYPPGDGFVTVVEHRVVCSEQAPPAEQLSLPVPPQQEGSPQ